MLGVFNLHLSVKAYTESVILFNSVVKSDSGKLTETFITVTLPFGIISWLVD
jgi:hypothetical protein